MESSSHSPLYDWPSCALNAKSESTYSRSPEYLPSMVLFERSVAMSKVMRSSSPAP